MTKRGGLGRGLAALIPTSAPVAEPAPDTEEATAGSAAVSSPPTVSLVPAPPSTSPFSAPSAPPASPAAAAEPAGSLGVPGAQLREVSTLFVVPTPYQPRQVFDDEA